MKNPMLKMLLAIFATMSVLVSCQKDPIDMASPQVFSSKYTNLTLNDLEALPNPVASEQFAVKLFDLKENGDGLTEKELLSVGNPAQNEDLLYALLFVEAFDRDEILWSWTEPAEEADETADRSAVGKWKWTGGEPIASMYASGFKKWPAYKVKNRFTDPCGETIKAGPVYQQCFKLCDADLPGPCQTNAYKEEVLEKIIADTPVDPYSIAAQLVQLAGWPLNADVGITATPVNLMNYERQVVSGNIVHYSFEMAVGAGLHDKIGIHRVVKETSPNKPIDTNKSIFLQTGDHGQFKSAIPGPYAASLPNDFGITVFLAENDVDVWGIDLAWALVPEATTDFSFMKDWGLEKDFTDLRTGMAVARLARFLSNDHIERMMLSAFSGGAYTGYAALDHETQLDPVVRHTKAYIPMDSPVKLEHGAYRNSRIDALLDFQSQYESGIYQQYFPGAVIGFLALNDPSGASPIVPGLTNEQAAIVISVSPQFAGSTYHFLAGEFVGNVPVGFQFIENTAWFESILLITPYQSMKFYVDVHTLMTDYADSPYDDHFAKIRLPIFNIAPAGGFGELTRFGFSQIGSTDVTHLMPSFYPPELAAIDFGHLDIFMANNAKGVVWEPMLEWMKEH